MEFMKREGNLAQPLLDSSEGERWQSWECQNQPLQYHRCNDKDEETDNELSKYSNEKDASQWRDLKKLLWWDRERQGSISLWAPSSEYYLIATTEEEWRNTHHWDWEWSGSSSLWAPPPMLERHQHQYCYLNNHTFILLSKQPHIIRIQQITTTKEEWGNTHHGDWEWSGSSSLWAPPPMLESRHHPMIPLTYNTIECSYSEIMSFCEPLKYNTVTPCCKLTNADSNVVFERFAMADKFTRTPSQLSKLAGPRETK